VKPHRDPNRYHEEPVRLFAAFRAISAAWEALFSIELEPSKEEEMLMSQRKSVVGLLLVTAAAVGIGIVIGANFNQMSEASPSFEEVSPVKARPLDFYVPNTEDLAPDWCHP
jgi:hypothetical protein